MSNANTTQELSLEERRAFMKLPIEERRRRMAEQAKRIAEHNESAQETAEREQWQGGDIVEQPVVRSRSDAKFGS